MSEMNGGANPNVAPIQKGTPNNPEITEFKTKGVRAFVKQDDGKLLAVKVRNKWTLPGAVMNIGETEEQCLSRGLRNCVGTTLGACSKFYEGPNTIVYAASVTTEGGRGQLPFAWLTEEQFLANTDAKPLFVAVFAAARTAKVASSKVISKLKDGRILFAIAHEVCVPGNDGRMEWQLREPHHVHAMNAALAKEQFLALVQPTDPQVRIIGVAPAIGFFQNEDGSLEG